MARVRPERKGYEVLIYQQHRDRLKSIQPTVDAGPPRPHPFSNKREQDAVRNLYMIIIETFVTHYIYCQIILMNHVCVETRVFEY